MAKRILVATLYKSGLNDHLLNVTPSFLKAKYEDEVFLIVKLDSSVPVYGDTIDCEISWGSHGINPFKDDPEFPISLNTPTRLGHLNKTINVEYTLSVIYHDKKYSEDPEMEIKG